MNIQKSFMPAQSVQTSVTTNLHEQFVSLNFQIIGMKNKLMALLLEIYQKEVYKEHKCEDIFEYAFKFARISRERVQKALRAQKALSMPKTFPLHSAGTAETSLPQQKFQKILV